MPSKKKPTPEDVSPVEIVGPPGCLANWGINYHPHGKKTTPEKRVEVGSIVGDLPDDFRAYLLAAGMANEVNPSE